eukprot:7510920-Pyramimonas_sp.AAC.1
MIERLSFLYTREFEREFRSLCVKTRVLLSLEDRWLWWHAYGNDKPSRATVMKKRTHLEAKLCTHLEAKLCTHLEAKLWYSHGG